MMLFFQKSQNDIDIVESVKEDLERQEYEDYVEKLGYDPNEENLKVLGEIEQSEDVEIETVPFEADEPQDEISEENTEEITEQDEEQDEIEEDQDEEERSEDVSKTVE